MENPLDSMADMPESFSEKLKVLRDSLEQILGLARETLDSPDLKSQNSNEFQMLSEMVPDFELAFPKALEAFAAARDEQLRVAREGLQVAEEFPGRMEALQKQLDESLEPFKAENFLPKTPDPIPPFLEILDIQGDIRQALLTLGEGQEEGAPGPLAPRISGNIWENWNREEAVADKSIAGPVADAPPYVFPKEILLSLGLDPEPEVKPKQGGNIWEGWK
jgi:hypothetical protein